MGQKQRCVERVGVGDEMKWLAGRRGEERGSPGTTLLLDFAHASLSCKMSSKFCYLNKFGDHCLTTKLVNLRKTYTQFKSNLILDPVI